VLDPSALWGGEPIGHQCLLMVTKSLFECAELGPPQNEALIHLCQDLRMRRKAINLFKAAKALVFKQRSQNSITLWSSLGYEKRKSKNKT
jgi:hypothetical protein